VSTPLAALALSATAAVMASLGVIVISGVVPATDALAATVAVGLTLAQRVKVCGLDPPPTPTTPGPVNSGLARQ
jgi:hypothetical protein